MAKWDDTFTLGTMVPGLSNTLKIAQQEIAAAKSLEQQAQQKLLSQFSTKIAELNNAIATAQRLFNDITNNLDSTGVNILHIGPRGGGYNALSTEIGIATNKPMTLTSGFFAASILLVSAPDLTQTASLYAKLQKLFTLQ